MPPAVALLSVVVNPAHTVAVPVIAAGAGSTVIVAALKQPVGNVYVMSVVPGVSAVTKPVPIPMFATAPMLLPHVPPALAFVKVVVEPWQIVMLPEIVVGVT